MRHAIDSIGGRLALLLLLAGPATDASAQDAVQYTVEITGVEDDGLRDLLEQSSQLIELEERLPQSVARLRVRADADIERLGKALRSQGFYDGTVTATLDTEAEPVHVRLDVSPGPAFTLARFAVRFSGHPGPPPERMPTLAEIGADKGAPAQAAAILSAEASLVTHLREQGYPLAKRLGHEALLYRDSRTLAITVEVDPGPSARFGSVRVNGLDRLELAYVRRLIPWRTGERYDLRKVAQARRALAGDALFASATVMPAEQVGADGRIDILVDVKEAKRRSIGAGVSYSTDIGPGANVYWEHRNLFGEGESLKLSLFGAIDEQVAEANYRDGSVGDGRYTYLSDLVVANRSLEAYDERSATWTNALEWALVEKWQMRAGISAEVQEIEEESDRDPQQFFLVGLPVSFSRDDTDDRLNPTRGSRVQFGVTPYAGAGERLVTFIAGQAGGSAYYGLDPAGRFVLAGRARVGVLGGEPTDDVPANKRYYAGGGGSIRGYEFQSVGPLDKGDDPLGGRALLELSGELRIRVTETIGIVPFVDAGTVFDDEVPTFDERIQYAAGLGLRYYTAIGPLRADIAVPINRRDIDDRFQFYVSLGQAF